MWIWKTVTKQSAKQKCLPISYIILPESAVWESTKINPTQLNIQFNRVTQTSQADFTLFSE